MSSETSEQRPKVAILTSSDAGSQGLRQDVSGQLLWERLHLWGHIVDQVVLADDAEILEAQLRDWIRQDIQLVVTTGGTGLGPRDVMPEVTLKVVDRLVPGIAEAMRQESLKHTPMGMLSRGVVGVANRTLVVNLPGSPNAIRELWPVVEPVLAHAVDLIAGHTRHTDPASS
ncbi:MAG: molybdenum cofactor biosynthesis protein [Sulfobacillus benefaciens]|uniref:Molybdenum cofactor biosynthesis protein n=1 Tax=Sulfobacillus benefaciens TaxID=453960 RepID=A0A2T2XES7_9FIRM|nr:MAG: molybdenum cofactor biosynthesis protein [Sulfobacillus benefaciens]